MELQIIRKLKINGERVDSETGLQYLRARYYDMEIGRFTTRDDYQGEDSTPVSLNRYLYGKGNPIKWVDPSGRFSLIELMTEENIITINSMIASVKLHGFLAMAVQTVWGIPWGEGAFQNPVANLDGISADGGINGLGGIGGYEKLYVYDKNENWYYSYMGGEIGFDFDLSGMDKLGWKVGASAQYYHGFIYDNRSKDKKDKGHNTGDYTGSFYSISLSAVKKIYGSKISIIPLGATVFSSGIGGGYYGYAISSGGSNSGNSISISGAWTYYYYLGSGATWDKYWESLLNDSSLGGNPNIPSK